MPHAQVSIINAYFQLNFSNEHFCSTKHLLYLLILIVISIFIINIKICSVSIYNYYS